jgi:acetyl-CoA carboxylase biotin carboxyl carrier protein
LDLRKIKKLIELVEESGISELEVRDGEEAIRIARPTGTIVAAAPQADAPHPGALQRAVASRVVAGVVTAPMAGTYYAASAPDVDPFIKVGDSVEVGQVVGIIESMKMMNEIVAETAGVCLAIDVANGQAVDSGQVLLRIE